eukprot:1107565-Rhodomonas_salina.2
MMMTMMTMMTMMVTVMTVMTVMMMMMMMMVAVMTVMVVMMMTTILMTPPGAAGLSQRRASRRKPSGGGAHSHGLQRVGHLVGCGHGGCEGVCARGTLALGPRAGGHRGVSRGREPVLRPYGPAPHANIHHQRHRQLPGRLPRALQPRPCARAGL